MSPRALVLVCALAAASGCGKSENEKRLDALGDVCRGFVAAGTTIRGATEAFNQLPVGAPVCLPGQDSGAPPDQTQFKRVDGDQCDHTGIVCQLRWCSLPENDPSLCGANGCYYGCGVRVVPRDDGNGGLVIDEDLVICGARWATEQPACPF
jgi:hypothetical protein